ncbi:Protein kinase domain [Arabidopsis thaliana x Arabidopsis arenosa]|uniref:Protein kinase domain n=1 Tax=Arabidopsis thaliana x Arabidopsis arenosa TaxID=1240361 RepID=A0A8T2CCQ7_9BRAS|nr:Protein kinase domain [Arabidopsis thaliana x Arabidopsis arenosa]
MSGKRGGNVLTWENRMQIVVEAAQGLKYLHNGCRPPMVHRDVKTTNILLNDRCGAKLADFGLSRSFPIDGESHVATVVAGTPGYLDPEYHRTNWLSEKSDVYSFGVVLLEIVTNQPVIDKSRERPHINEWVGFMLTKGDIKSIVDPKLMGDYDTNGAWKIVELALACVNPSSKRRPTMAHVVMELNECVALENARRQGSEEMHTRGFISLDCGLVPKETTYLEATTNITYKSDANYTDSGLVGKINDAHKTLVQQPLWAVRSFPEGQRNCYNFNLTVNSTYLIRGTFMYGNYDGLNQSPSFDLHIGASKWTSVNIIEETDTVMPEIIHVLTQDRLQVCLVKTGKTTPFISSLELRPLQKGTYIAQSGSLVLQSRYFSSDSTSIIRYDEDIHDRVWNPISDDGSSSISTDLEVQTNNFYDVPQAVMRTAAIPKNASAPWSLVWTIENTTALSYVYMHFAEIQNLKANESREFNITYNGGKLWYTQFRPTKLTIITMYSQVPLTSSNGVYNFTFEMTSNSTLPPLLNALEIYTGVDILQLHTDKDEVSAITNIKTTYGLSKKISWQGDPCAPQLYRNLNASRLNGTITSDITKLTQLSELNLSGNPKLNLTVPDSLQQRVNSKSLTLILGEKVLNPTPKKESKKVPMVTIAASVAGVFALLLILAIFFIVRGKKGKRNEAPGPPPSVTSGIVKSETRSSNPAIITKDRKITYPEVLKMTNNFERVLGKGGFGTVYHGNLNDAQVAVKMLSHSSAQGYKEFKAEVELLLRVHHRHLVGLVGYCDDGDNLALIYEYMANGDLRENMSGKRGGNVLTWENRMQIAVEAAQGLEYLHNGCTPPMVHRDVKTTNILLNERCGAKLADFGLSRSFPIDGECHVSTVVAGTPGYLDPEYYRTNWLSEKSDVYSFGVVLLEIVTNQPVIDKSRERPHINEWVGFMLTKGDIKSIVDPKLMGDYDINGAWKIVELALACVNPSSNLRPTMAQVVIELNECVAFENARRQGSEEMHTRGSTDFSYTSSASEFAPGAR